MVSLDNADALYDLSCEFNGVIYFNFIFNILMTVKPFVHWHFF